MQQPIFRTILTIWSCLLLLQVPRSRDLAIFMGAAQGNSHQLSTLYHFRVPNQQGMTRYYLIFALLVIHIGHGPFSHLFEKDVVKPLKKELPLVLKNFPKVDQTYNDIMLVHVHIIVVTTIA